MVTGTTAIVGLIGTPILQVKMPSLMNPYFAEQGLDCVLIPMDIGQHAIESFVATVRGWHNLLGIVVTVPYKQVLAPYMDGLTDRARRFSTVNAFRRDKDGTLHGDMFDGVGFVNALDAKGVGLAGKRAAVIGAGGVASAITNSLCESGVSRLFIQDMDSAKQDRLIATLRGAFPAIDIRAGIESVRDLDLLVNGTPVGMNDDPRLPLSADLLSTLSPDCFVADVVTAPAMTPFLRLAQQRGCAIQIGTDMTAPQMLTIARFLRAAP